MSSNSRRASIWGKNGQKVDIPDFTCRPIAPTQSWKYKFHLRFLHILLGTQDTHYVLRKFARKSVNLDLPRRGVDLHSTSTSKLSVVIN